MYDDLAKLLSDFIKKSGSSIDDVYKNFDNYLDDAIKNGFDYSTINSQEKLNQFYDARTKLKSYYENQHGDFIRQQRQLEIEAKKKASKASDPEYWNGQKKFNKWDQTDGSTLYNYYNEQGDVIVSKTIGPDGKRDVSVLRSKQEMENLPGSDKHPSKRRIIRDGDNLEITSTPDSMHFKSRKINLETGEVIDTTGTRNGPWLGGQRSIERKTGNLYDDLARKQSKNLNVKKRRIGMGSIRESAGLAGFGAEFKNFFQVDQSTGKPFIAPWSKSGRNLIHTKAIETKANLQVDHAVRKAKRQEARRARQNSNNRRMTVEEARQARQERRSQKNREIEQPKINADTVEESINRQSETVINKTKETVNPGPGPIEDNIGDANKVLDDALDNASNKTFDVNNRYKTPETFEDFYENIQQNRNVRVDNTPIDNTAPEVPETPEVLKTPETPEINYNRPDDFSNVLNPEAANEALDEALNNAMNNINNKVTGNTSTLGNTINLNRSNNINTPKSTSINLNQTTSQTVNQTANQTVNQAVNQQAQNANNILNNAINQQNANLNSNLGNTSANILNNQRNAAAQGYTTKPITGVGPNGQLIKSNQSVVKNVNNGSATRATANAANNAGVNPLKTFKDMSALEKVMTGVNVLGMVGDYKQARREGHGVVSSAVRAGAQFAFAEAMGWWYIPYSIVKEAPGAIIKGADALYKENRRMNSASTNQVFGGAQFQDTQQLATMRQSGMEMAKMAQYNLQQTLMGQEATYLHR